MPPHALSDVDTDSNFHLPIADSFAGSPEIAQRGQQNSEDWESVVNDSFPEQQTNQEERNLVQTLGQRMDSFLLNLTPGRRRCVEAGMFIV